MTAGKRAFDLGLALVLLLPLGLVMLVVAAVVLVADGRPVLYGAERMRAPGRPFQLWKFRTMRPQAGDGGVSGGAKAARITRTGAILRRRRLDELPQLFNILRGDMSFVGPRPPLRGYVERFPDLYARVLRSRPGVTGLASLMLYRREERLLARCATPEETDRVYCRRCIPLKARIDLIYQRRRTAWLDLLILWRTLLALFARHPGGPARP